MTSIFILAARVLEWFYACTAWLCMHTLYTVFTKRTDESDEFVIIMIKPNEGTIAMQYRRPKLHGRTLNSSRVALAPTRLSRGARTAVTSGMNMSIVLNAKLEVISSK